MTSQLFSLTEQLESRFLLASDFASLNSRGFLSVVGTSKNNSITIDISGSKVRTMRDGVSLSFTKSKVKGIFVDAFKGNDTIRNKTAIPSTLMGSGGNDSITGGTGIDSIDAGTGADHLSGGGGGPATGLPNRLILDGTDDTIDYSNETAGDFTGEDPDLSVPYNITYRNNSSVDQIVRQGGFTIQLTSGNDSFFSDAIDTDITVKLGAGNDQFFARHGISKRVEGGDGKDTIDINGDSAIRQISLGSGNDTIQDHYGGELTTFIDGGPGHDTWDLNPDDPFQTAVYRRDVPAAVETLLLSSPQSQQVIVFGNGLNNFIRARGGTVELHGGSGNDTLTASSTIGRSSVFGESGDDVLINGIGGQTFSGGSGHDTIDYSLSTKSVSIKLDNKANDGGEFDTLDNAEGSPVDDVRSDIETVIGGSSAGDYLQGTPNAERFVGNAGNDTIWAGGGNDTLDGGTGRDSLFGQDGNDTFFAKDGEKDSLDGGSGSDKAQRDNASSVKDSVLSIESFI